MPYIVTAKISGKRIRSGIFQDKSQAVGYAYATKKDRRGSNPRVVKVR